LVVGIISHQLLVLGKEPARPMGTGSNLARHESGAGILPARQAGFQPAHFFMSSGLEGRLPRRLEACVTSALKGSLSSLKMFNL
jgi:hypothetical protein